MAQQAGLSVAPVCRRVLATSFRASLRAITGGVDERGHRSGDGGPKRTAGGTVAQHLGLPFINVCPSLPLNREPDIPAPFFSWQFAPSRVARLRNRIEHTMADWLISPINRTINRYSSRMGTVATSQP